MAWTLSSLILLIAISISTSQVAEVDRTQENRMILEAFMNRSAKDLFKAWHLLFKREYSYASDEAKLRFKNFKDNLTKIKEHNAQNLSFKVGLNQFSDMSNEEFKQKFATYKVSATVEDFINTWQEKVPETTTTPSNNASNGSFLAEEDDDDLTKRNLSGENPIDYRSNFNPPRNQNYCGGCWAFALTAIVEAKQSMKQGWTNQYLSIQQLLDCNNSNYGCNGGDLITGMNYILNNGNQNDKDYTYLGYSGNQCNYSKSKPLTRITGYQYCSNITPNYKCSSSVVYNLLKKGPLAVVVNGGSWAFQNYSGGIFSAACYNVDHAVVIVGYGVSGSTPYWLVRNSWGPYWGENGHIRIAVNSNNNYSCFLEYMAVLPIM
jgi:C1A family cysteine protease